MVVECHGLILLQEERRLLATLPASSGCPSVDMPQLRECIAQAGYAGWFVDEAAISHLLLSLQQGTSCERFPVGDQRDGTFSLTIADDLMTVWLALSPAWGGESVKPDDVFLALGEMGITFGIDPDVVQAACAANVEDRVAIATGIPVVKGADARFELLTNDVRDRTPHVNEQGFIDFRDLGEIPTVEADQPLMRRIPATPGTPGRNVRGEEIPAEPGCNTAFSEHLDGSYLDKNDPNLLRATFNGQPVCTFNGVSVEQVLRLRNVNMATGHIAFDGSVQIEGEVLPGMKVNVTGDIIVGGVVDGATLVAGGDIQIGGGVIAKASVRAEGSVMVRFVENAQVFAGTTLVVGDSALQADLQANNRILVGAKNTRGKLAGGCARAMLQIQVPVLGATTGGVTELQMGVNPVLDAKYRDLLSAIEKKREEEGKLEKLVKHLAKQGDKSGMLERANASWQAAVKAWGALLPERDALERELAHMAEARVEVGAVAGAVDLGFGKKRFRVRKNLDAGVFSLQGDQVIFTNAAGTLVPLA